MHGSNLSAQWLSARNNGGPRRNAHFIFIFSLHGTGAITVRSAAHQLARLAVAIGWKGLERTQGYIKKKGLGRMSVLMGLFSVILC